MPTQPYDLVDTTNDQVYRGYLPGNDKTRAGHPGNAAYAALPRPAGTVLLLGQQRGQTELVETVWPTDEDFGYYAFGDDPYDVANTLDRVLQRGAQL